MVLGGGRRGLRGGRRARRGGRATWRRAGGRKGASANYQPPARARRRQRPPVCRRHGRAGGGGGESARGNGLARAGSACDRPRQSEGSVCKVPARLRGAGGRSAGVVRGKRPQAGTAHSCAAAARRGECAGVARVGNAHEPAGEATPWRPSAPLSHRPSLALPRAGPFPLTPARGRPGRPHRGPGSQRRAALRPSGARRGAGGRERPGRAPLPPHGAGRSVSRRSGEQG